jgi:hypothetical protein
VLQILINTCGFEVVGTKVVNAKKEIYTELVPRNIRHIFKTVAMKFN